MTHRPCPWRSLPCQRGWWGPGAPLLPGWDPVPRDVSLPPPDDSKHLQDLRLNFALGISVDPSTKREFPLGWKDEGRPFLPGSSGDQEPTGMGGSSGLVHLAGSYMGLGLPPAYPPGAGWLKFPCFRESGIPSRPDDPTPRLWEKHRGRGVLEASLLHALARHPRVAGSLPCPLSNCPPPTPLGHQSQEACVVFPTRCTQQAAGPWCRVLRGWGEQAFIPSGQRQK